MQALQNCPPPPSPLLQSALEREAKAIRAQKFVKLNTTYIDVAL